jgi:hypothetical protein
VQGVARQFSPAFIASHRAPRPRLPAFAIGEEDRVKKTLEEKMTALIAAKDFDGLEELATVLRRSQLETASGVWYLSTFYHILTYEWPETANLPEHDWIKRQTFLKNWTQTSPLSITARVALARYWKNYAWKARGTGLAATVTPEAWALFEARLEQATQVLADARKLRAKCPVWWDTMQFVALGRNARLTDYNLIFDEAVNFEPAYTQFYINKATYLTPRWYGKEGDWQKFAADEADKKGGDAGDILYARIGWRLHQRGFYTAFLRDSGYSWKRMKSGLQLIVAKHAQSLTPANELAYLAYQADDKKCARPLFAQIGKVADRDTWHDDMVRFVRARTWAMID